MKRGRAASGLAGITRVSLTLVALGSSTYFTEQLTLAVTNSTLEFAGFTNSFNPASARTLFAINPASQHNYEDGLFYRSDVVILSNATASTPIRMWDYRGTLITNGASPIVFPANSLRVNHYFVESGNDRMNVAVLPADYRGGDLLGLEGVSGTRDPAGVARTRKMKPHWQRVYAEWGVIERTPGLYDWSNNRYYGDSAILNYAAPNVLLYLDGCGLWSNCGGLANKRLVWLSSTNYSAAYANWVKTATGRYLSSNVPVRAVELFNEPFREKFDGINEGGFWALMSSLISTGAATIHGMNPAIAVVAPSFDVPAVVAYRWGSLAGLHALDNVDIFAWHDYIHTIATPDQTFTYTNEIPGWIPSPSVPQIVQDTFAAAGRAAPFQITEISIRGLSPLWARQNPMPFENGYPQALPWQKARDRTVKLAVLYRASGATALYPHSTVGALITNNLSGPIGDADWDYAYRGPQPKLSAFLMTCYWLNGLSPAGSEQTGPLWHLTFTNAVRQVEFYWTLEGSTTNIPFAVDSLTDTYGNPIRTTEVGSMPLIARGRRP
jgi:hypothetical protein